MAKTEIIKLNMLGLPVIQSIDDFSVVTHISKYTIYQLSHHSDKYYKTFEIPKKSGGKRTICQPSKKLKGLQSWILVNILNKIQVSPSCKGFRKGSSTLDNALPHIGANTILNLDLKDFFPTVSSKQVYNVFKTIGYNKLIATVFTNICTYNDMLPQGSPCSPMLANLTAWNLDLRIQGYVGKRGISYTRYADDLSFSGLNPTKVVKIIPMIKTIINDENFEVNHKKTRIASSARAKIVTGLIVNEDSVGIGKQKYKDLRAKIHHLILPTEQKNEKLLYHVGGWLSYLNSVDKLRLQKAKKYISELTKKYPTTLIARLDK
ncbi:RNA-directed DNA polymerase [Flavobacterium sp. XN-5]|uniref:retron St85 family RNA-directed DNA polymerase n=1 Tax=Flavobacterium sp. XN-5 TaxID=2599390 RepID=UPI0011CC338C|nr:retron St85 family RNA-directed DNA polymerase [Flavobacterium sp. XN-5]NGY38979.1 RNA-directed DNA polymerase [Flavobacterium sp. XN-5]